MDVETCYRERTQATRSRYPHGPVHVTLVGAPRLLCDPNAYVDAAHRPAVDSAVTCKRCLRIIEKGDYQRADGHPFSGPAPVVSDLRVTLVVPAALVGKLQRQSTTRGLPYSKVLTLALHDMPDISTAYVDLLNCEHPGQKVNRRRPDGLVDRVCQTCHSVLETLPGCPKLNAKGQPCNGFVREGYRTCRAHAR